MKRVLFTLLVVAASLSLPYIAHAQIIPACDRTRYIVPQGGWIWVEGNSANHTITPDLYFEDPTVYNPAAGTGDAAAGVEVTTTRACGFQDFVQLFVNIINWAFSILAIVAAFFFVWGGFSLLIAGGRSEWIETGKKTIQGTVVGVLIVLTSYIIVNFYVSALVGKNTATFFSAGVPNPLAPQSCQKEFTENNAMEGRNRSCGYGNVIFGCTDANKTGPVRDVQRLLNSKCNGLCGDANGCYGNQTSFCVRMFQLANTDPVTGEPLDATGEVDAGTWDAIRDPARTDCFTTREITEGDQKKTVPITYQNPMGFAEYENAFQTKYVQSTTDHLGEFGSCAPSDPSLRAKFGCMSAHGPFECPNGVVTRGTEVIDVTFEYSEMPCAWTFGFE